MSSALSNTLRTALAAVGQKTEATENSMAVVPTAKTRQVLDRLSSSSAEQLQQEEVNLREMCQDLFNWNGDNRSNKTLIRAFNTALNTEGKYAHTVELTAFLAACAPLLEGDRIARLYAAVGEVESVYAPAKYTLQLSSSIKDIFGEMSQERIERLIYSLWVSSHNGNWWDITLGPEIPTGEEVVQEIQEAEPFEMSMDEVVENLLNGSLHWHEELPAILNQVIPNEEIVTMFKNYRERLNEGETVPTEPSLFSSFIPGLEISDRPESPVQNLLFILKNVKGVEGYRAPNRPREFRELFPPMERQVHETFPISRVFQDLARLRLPEGSGVRLIIDPLSLAANGKHMGNCTNSYRGEMERGSYALFHIIYKDVEYNAAVSHSGRGEWRLREINSRFNRGNVPDELRNAFSRYAEGLTRAETDVDIMPRIRISKILSDKSLKLY